MNDIKLIASYEPIASNSRASTVYKNSNGVSPLYVELYVDKSWAVYDKSPIGKAARIGSNSTDFADAFPNTVLGTNGVLKANKIATKYRIDIPRKTMVAIMDCDNTANGKATLGTDLGGGTLAYEVDYSLPRSGDGVIIFTLSDRNDHKASLDIIYETINIYIAFATET
jgi:hypothetical protein